MSLLWHPGLTRCLAETWFYLRLPPLKEIGPYRILESTVSYYLLFDFCPSILFPYVETGRISAQTVIVFSDLHPTLFDSKENTIAKKRRLVLALFLWLGHDNEWWIPLHGVFTSIDHFGFTFYSLISQWRGRTILFTSRCSLLWKGIAFVDAVLRTLLSTSFYLWLSIKSGCISLFALTDTLASCHVLLARYGEEPWFLRPAIIYWWKPGCENVVLNPALCFKEVYFQQLGLVPLLFSFYHWIQRRWSHLFSWCCLFFSLVLMDWPLPIWWRFSALAPWVRCTLLFLIGFYCLSDRIKQEPVNRQYWVAL